MKHGDNFIIYSTMDEFSSFRSATMGSPFINALCDIVEEEGRENHLDDLLTKVTGRMKNIKIGGTKVQIPEKVSTLSKKFYLPLRN